jgi:hypothetical protein
VNQSIYFLDLNQPSAAPGNQRMDAFKKFYSHYNIHIINRPKNFFSYLFLFCRMFFKSNTTLWISMPPFRFWSLLLLPFTNKVLDIRDGWSIAMLCGYGNTKNPTPIKAKIARCLEILAFIMAKKVIVCTPGIQAYYMSFLPTFLNKKMILIPNGFNTQYRATLKVIKNSPVVRCVCAGKFSIYGADKAKTVLRKLSDRYSNKKIELILIGGERENENWIPDFLRDNGINIDLTIIPNMQPNELDKILPDMDLGIAIVRDPNYELGTKSFLYIAHGIPIFNYFDSPNRFTHFFSDFLDNDLRLDAENSKFSREYQIQKNAEYLSL